MHQELLEDNWNTRHCSKKHYWCCCNIHWCLTYEDVTNIDSVGIITARSNVSIADSIIHTGDTDTSIRFPAAGTFTVSTNGSEAVRVDSSGRLLVGTTSSSKNATIVAQGNSDSATSSAELYMQRGQSSPNDGATFATILFGDSGGGQGAAILSQRDGGTWSGSSKPGRLIFSTTADGASSVSERVRIASAGQIGLGGANYGTSGQVITSNGSGSAPTWQDAGGGGITTEALVSSGIVTTLNLTAAQDHKVTASGITTITVSGGTEADSHTVRIINSGITTVGFSTYFLFPSGSAPSLPTANGAISLISFTVNRVGTAGTQLLAGASVNFS